MTQQRPTLATLMQRAGYRAVALMPGLRYSWPEGAFYGFDTIYDSASLAYAGPEFGWWRIPDQFALARLDADELRTPERRPLFVFFPTVSSHAPFRPTPPYQPDWPRILGDTPFDAEETGRALARPPQWTDMRTSYAGSVDYALRTLAGYLRERAEADFVMIIIGDHQPPANVSGPGASWDVPVHVLSRERDLTDLLLARGFAAGAVPARPVVSRTHELLPILLEAFGAAGGGQASQATVLEARSIESGAAATSSVSFTSLPSR